MGQLLGRMSRVAMAISFGVGMTGCSAASFLGEGKANDATQPSTSATTLTTAASAGAPPQAGGCDGGGALDAEPIFSLLGAYQSEKITVSGGVAPYTFATGMNQPCLVSQTGVVTTLSTANPICDVVVTDSAGGQVDVQVEILSSTLETGGSNPLYVGFSADVLPMATTQLWATGGTPPYTYVVDSVGDPSNPSQCSVSLTTGLFTAGQALESCMIKITDSAGASLISTVNVGLYGANPIFSDLASLSTVSDKAKDGLQIQPAFGTVSMYSTLQLSASGGNAPYTYSAEGLQRPPGFPSPCTVSSSALVSYGYGPTPAACLVHVTDASGYTATSIVDLAQ